MRCGQRLRGRSDVGCGRGDERGRGGVTRDGGAHENCEAKVRRRYLG